MNGEADTVPVDPELLRDPSVRPARGLGADVYAPNQYHRSG
ncbi:hypothetical protein ACFU9B_41005 [Streptomyces sp. NPDC057592]